MINEQNTNEQHSKLLIITLKLIAKEKGLTYQDIADKTGLKQSNVARIFSLKYNASLPNFIAIARAVGVNFFFEDKENKISDLSVIFNKAMDELGRNPDNISKN